MDYGDISVVERKIKEVEEREREPKLTGWRAMAKRQGIPEHTINEFLEWFKANFTSSIDSENYHVPRRVWEMKKSQSNLKN